MEIRVSPDNHVLWPAHRVPCAIGRAGRIDQADKREGDGMTPIGTYPLRRVYFRPDRGTAPKTSLPCRPLTQSDGWCDAPDDPAYNKLVSLPYPARAETLWREDCLYDIILEIGHNDAPVKPGLGSAVFVHVAKPGYPPTEGCVALAKPDLVSLLASCQPGDIITID